MISSVASESWACQSSTSASNELLGGIRSYRMTWNLLGSIWLCDQAKIHSPPKQGELGVLSWAFRAKWLDYGTASAIIISVIPAPQVKSSMGPDWCMGDERNWESPSASIDDTRSLAREKAAWSTWMLKSPKANSPATPNPRLILPSAGLAGYLLVCWVGGTPGPHIQCQQFSGRKFYPTVPPHTHQMVSVQWDSNTSGKK